MLRKPCLLALLAAALLLAAAPAAAHKTNVFAYVENGKLQGEAYFSGGNKAQGCMVEVWDATGKKLAATKTDTAGGFSLRLPQGRPPYKVVLKAGQGHQADYSLSAQELGLAPAQGAAPVPAIKTGATVPPSLDRGASLGRAELEQMLSTLLQKELAPLKAQLARLSEEQGVTLRDVLAGLGYILGLMGLAAYMHFRKQGKGE